MTASSSWAAGLDGAQSAWTCYYTDFPVVRVHDGALTGWHSDGTAAKALITDGSRIALYGGYGTDRNRLITGHLTNGRIQVTEEYRVVLPDGHNLPNGTLVIGRGPDLHILTHDDWYRIGLHDIREREADG
jgi:hypothetical protein